MNARRMLRLATLLTGPLLCLSGLTTSVQAYVGDAGTGLLALDCEYVYACAQCTPDPHICIPDEGFAAADINISAAPEHAVVTAVRVKLKIQDAGEHCDGSGSAMYCSDIRIQLNSNQHMLGQGWALWDANPGRTDGGWDDDVENDQDIELDRICESFFDGEPVNQGWYLDVWDESFGDMAELAQLEVWICYVVPPDLFDGGETTSAFSPVAACPGAELDVHCTIRNAGTVPSGQFEVDFYASQDSEISAADHFIGSTIMSIGGEQSAACDWFGPLPDDLPAGQYWIGWIIDARDDVAESDETNNIARKRGYKLTVNSISQAPTQISVEPSSVCPGDRATLTVGKGALGSNADWVWYSRGCGDGYLAEGAALEVFPRATSTYYVRGEGDCGTTDCGAVTVTVADATAWYADVDGDGYGDPESVPDYSCAPIPGKVDNNGDCDDTRADWNPDAPEVRDGLDNNCNGQIDEDVYGPPPIWHRDADGDGYGVPSDGIAAWQQPPGYVLNAADCDDTAPGANPGQVIDCADGVDNDCDGLIDEDESLDPACRTQPGTDDLDGDGIADAEDNCPETSNPDQADSNGDGIGDACDPFNACGAQLLCGQGMLSVLPLIFLSLCVMKIRLPRPSRRR